MPVTTEPDGRDLIAHRLDDQGSWLRQATGWLTQLHAGQRRRSTGVAVDGKTLRGARTPGGDGRPVHLLDYMDHASRAVLAQRQVGGAPEEVPAFTPLLDGLNLAGWWSPPTYSKPPRG